MATPKPANYGFDAQIYFRIVAENLLKQFGARAVGYADEALAKMEAMGDHEGLALWRGIQHEIVKHWRTAALPTGTMVH